MKVVATLVFSAIIYPLPGKEADFTSWLGTPRRQWNVGSIKDMGVVSVEVTVMKYSSL